MGRKTYGSIGKALEDRTNIVLTAHPDFGAGRVEPATNLEPPLRYARKDAGARRNEIIVIGGGDVSPPP